MFSHIDVPFISIRASAEINLHFQCVEAPVWQGAKAMAYQDIASFRNAAKQDASALENVKLFLR
jgi:hypothetical protein